MWAKEETRRTKALRERINLNMGNMLDYIQQYNLRGFATFPVNSKTKRPLAPGWKNRRADVFEVLDERETYGSSGAYGILLNPTDFIIDIDPRNFKPGDNPWKRLREDLNLPNLGKATYKVKTGGGGAHVYFKKPADLDLVFKLHNYPGLDVKAGLKDKGTYVVGPGSVHESGKKYSIIDGTGLAYIEEAPKELLELAAKTKRAEIKGTGALDGGEQEKKRYISWLKKFPPAVEGENGDHQTYKAAVKGRDYGLAIEDTIQAMLSSYNPKCKPEWTDEEIELKVNNAYKYATQPAGKEDPSLAFKSAKQEWDAEADELRKWDLDQNEKPKRTLRNAINYLYLEADLKGAVRYNEFTGDLEIPRTLPWGGTKVWTDTDAVLLKYYLAKKVRVEFSTALLWEALYAAGNRHSYHPIREHIEGFKWDGTARLDTWLSDYCGAKQDGYTANVGRKLIIGMVARIFKPGVKFDYCLILEGAQGIGKSTVCAILGGGWYGDIVLDPHARDTVDAIRGKWVVELSEMEVTRRSDAQALKAFISRTTDRARLAYERTTKDFPRQCVFVGTINPDEMGYLSDNTGNRRFWPVKCGGDFDLDAFKGVRDQLIAEAYQAFKKGEVLYLKGNVAKLAEIEQNKRRHVDPWQDVAEDWLEAEGKEVQELSMQQVYELILGGNIKNISRTEQCRIGRILSDMGWNKHRPNRGGSRQFVYRKPENI